MTTEDYLKMAVEAARLAGEFLKTRQGIKIDADEAHDMKLSTDRDSEKIILDALAAAGLGVLTEERGIVGANSKLHWIVDPLDGTVNYFRGADDLSCVSIALFDGDEPILGVINRFAADELFTGVAGEGAALNGQPIQATGEIKLNNAVLATGFPAKHEYTAESIIKFADRVRAVKKVRMLGSAAIMGAYVACGRVDIYTEENIRLWDIAAAMAIVKAAGGAVSLRQRPNDDLHRCIFGAFASEKLMREYLAL
jgi:myo-inositol-1(or 4)-monophosphatase